MKFVRTKERKGDNFKFLKAFGPVFGLNDEKNPIVHHFDDSWQVIVAYLLYFKHLSLCITLIAALKHSIRNEGYGNSAMQHIPWKVCMRQRDNYTVLY